MAKNSLHHMKIGKASNGGHIITHHSEAEPSYHMDQFPGEAENVEHHVFSKDQGQQALAHIAKHLGIKEDDEGETPATKRPFGDT